MCKKVVCLMTIVLLLGLSSAAVATTYYVSPTGDDTKSGTSPSEAWQTIAHVNEVSFADGDTILLEGSQTHSGSLWILTDDGGTVANPLKIGSYGSGRATISSGKDNGIYAYNRAALEIRDLILVGSGSSDPDGTEGIGIWTDLDGDVKLEHVYIDNVEARAYRKKGITIGGWNGLSGFKDVRITNCVAHDIGDVGIHVWGYEWPSSGWANQDVYVADCVTYDNPGIPGIGRNTGNGICVSGTDGATIEYCESYNNGWLNESHAGPVAIWFYYVNNGVIQFCEAHHQQTGPTGGDGGGFDLDCSCTNCTVQYCYSHDNEGPGLLLCTDTPMPCFGNTYRYCITENDGTGSTGEFGAMQIYTNKVLGTFDVYNCTAYVSAATHGPGIHIWQDRGGSVIARFRNNIFVTAANKSVVNLYSGKDTNLTFQGNCYWTYNDNIEIKWGRSTYTSLAAWRDATGQEILDGNDVGFETDPCLVNPGGANDYDYKLQDTSPMIDAGLDLQTLFGIDPGPNDYFGTSIPQDGYYDVGAHESTAAVPDNDPPSPNPMSWATVPYAVSDSVIAMVATTATDISGVEYYFDCLTTGGHDSDWQDETSYEDTGLNSSTEYCYQVKARDKSPNQNETGWSSTECATTNPPDTTPPEPDPMTWATVPYATGSSSIAMVATTASDPSGVEYYFDCLTTGGHDSDWQDETNYTDTGLDPNTPYCYKVQARDKSANQNATGWSSTECATTEVAGEGTLFSDDFEDNNIDSWNTFGTCGTATDPYEGNYCARVKITPGGEGAWMEKPVSTAGYTNIQVKYARRTAGNFSAGEYLYVEWYDGNSWNELEATQDDSYVYKEMTCGSGADNNADFKIRYRINTNKNNEFAHFDSVEVIGTQ